MISAAPGVLDQDAALWCRRGSPPRMGAMHRHNDVEINVVLEGELHYLFAGRHLVVREGQIAAFWAAQPHGLVGSTPGDACWVHVPLSTVIGWRLPEAELRALIRMEPLVIDGAGIGPRLESMVSLWLEEISEPETSGIALLEIQAALRRIIRAADGAQRGSAGAGRVSAADPTGEPGTSGPIGSPGEPPPERARHALRMAECVLGRYREELTVEDVARSVHLTPSHAMTVFRAAVGVTLGEYITMFRVAEAQRLLLTTSMTSAEVAGASGFGSLSSYYSHVTAACGMSPRRYRLQGS